MTIYALRDVRAPAEAYDAILLVETITPAPATPKQ